MAKFTWKVEKFIGERFLQDILHEHIISGWDVYQINPLKRYIRDSKDNVTEHMEYNVIFKRQKEPKNDKSS